MNPYLKILTMIAVLSLNLFAIQPQVHQCMVKMEQGLKLIQKGYLYGNMETVHLGISEIKKANDQFSGVNIKECLPEDKQHMDNIAHNSAMGIRHAIGQMEKRLEDNEISKAYEAVPVILRNCITCHALVRSW